MGKFFNKLRQVFNIFLLSALIAAVAAVFVYFLTSPEQRGTTFWISVGFLVFALILETLQASGIAMRSNKGQNIPMGFTRFILGAIYFILVIALAVWNALAPFSTTKYILIHIGVLAVFLIPMVLINMSELRLSGSDRKQQAEGRQNLASLANRVGYVVEDLRAAGLPAESLRQIANFAEALRYSDPTPASGRIERTLEEAVKNLEDAVTRKDLAELSRLCTLGERALKERNEAVKNAK